MGKQDSEGEKKEAALAELATTFEAWLVPEKLEPLHKLETQAEAMADPLRKEAKLALNTITARLKELERVLPTEEYDALVEKYRTLSRAVGMLNGGKVDHAR